MWEAIPRPSPLREERSCLLRTALSSVVRKPLLCLQSSYCWRWYVNQVKKTLITKAWYFWSICVIMLIVSQLMQGSFFFRADFSIWLSSVVIFSNIQFAEEFLRWIVNLIIYYYLFSVHGSEQSLVRSSLCMLRVWRTVEYAIQVLRVRRAPRLSPLLRKIPCRTKTSLASRSPLHNPPLNMQTKKGYESK